MHGCNRANIKPGETLLIGGAGKELFSESSLMILILLFNFKMIINRSDRAIYTFGC